KGMGRQDGYVLVQRNAMRAFHGQGDFRALLKQDADIRSRLSEAEIDAQFDLEHALAHTDTIIERALRAVGP
ncbi:MAG TPA: adenylosuccinate lyase, partial [Polyangiales bacterium]|nr:adenylosuccinate lyase [Polyangiales bacterium]